MASFNLKKTGQMYHSRTKMVVYFITPHSIESERTDDVFQVRVMMVIVEADFKIFARIGVAFPLR